MIWRTKPTPAKDGFLTQSATKAPRLKARGIHRKTVIFEAQQPHINIPARNQLFGTFKSTLDKDGCDRLEPSSKSTPDAKPGTDLDLLSSSWMINSKNTTSQ
jgi:hypothetical protein